MQALQLLKGATDKGGINTELQVGDRENTLGDTATIGDIEAEDGGVVNINQSKPKFDGQANTVVINETDNKRDLILLLLCIIGWLLPTPAQMWSGLQAFLFKLIKGR